MAWWTTDLRAGPISRSRRGSSFDQSDPTCDPIFPLACLFQQRLLALTGPRGGRGPEKNHRQRPPTDGAGRRGESTRAWIGRVRRGAVASLHPPAPRSTVTRWRATAGLALAALQVPVSRDRGVAAKPDPHCQWGLGGHPRSGGERGGARRSGCRHGAAHDVVTADGVVGELSATALAAADTLRIERVAPTTAPASLPGSRSVPWWR